MTKALARLPASPYARKLARIGAIPLELLTGSGPAGRIVAADVLAYTPTISDSVLPEPAIPNTEVRTPDPGKHSVSARSAFSCAISPSPVRALIANAEAAGFVLQLEDIALRAAAHAIAVIGRSGANAIAFESEGRRFIVETDLRLSIGHNRKARLTAIESRFEDLEGKAVFSLKIAEATRISSLLISLPPGQIMRLQLTQGAEADSIAALLCTDPDGISDETSVDFLAAFTAAMEQPLLLLA